MRKNHSDTDDIRLSNHLSNNKSNKSYSNQSGTLNYMRDTRSSKKHQQSTEKKIQQKYYNNSESSDENQEDHDNHYSKKASKQHSAGKYSSSYQSSSNQKFKNNSDWNSRLNVRSIDFYQSMINDERNKGHKDDVRRVDNWRKNMKQLDGVKSACKNSSGLNQTDWSLYDKKGLGKFRRKKIKNPSRDFYTRQYMKDICLGNTKNIGKATDSNWQQTDLGRLIKIEGENSISRVMRQLELDLKNKESVRKRFIHHLTKICREDNGFYRRLLGFVKEC